MFTSQEISNLSQQYRGSGRLVLVCLPCFNLFAFGPGFRFVVAGRCLLLVRFFFPFAFLFSRFFFGGLLAVSGSPAFVLCSFFPFFVLVFCLLRRSCPFVPALPPFVSFLASGASSGFSCVAGPLSLLVLLPVFGHLCSFLLFFWVWVGAFFVVFFFSGRFGVFFGAFFSFLFVLFCPFFSFWLFSVTCLCCSVSYCGSLLLGFSYVLGLSFFSVWIA